MTWRTWSNSTLPVTWTCCAASRACKPGGTDCISWQLTPPVFAVWLELFDHTVTDSPVYLVCVCARVCNVCMHVFVHMHSCCIHAWVYLCVTLTVVYVFVLCTLWFCMYVCACVPVCACVRGFVCSLCFPCRLDMIIGPQSLSSRAKTFSTPSLPVYYSQGRKNSTQGSECPPSILYMSHGFSSLLIQSIQVAPLKKYDKGISYLWQKVGVTSLNWLIGKWSETPLHVCRSWTSLFSRASFLGVKSFTNRTLTKLNNILTLVLAVALFLSDETFCWTLGNDWGLQADNNTYNTERSSSRHTVEQVQRCTPACHCCSNADPCCRWLLAETAADPMCPPSICCLV